ncbi:MAG: EAL domain-containing protein, partial [Oscillospiraceae bacterium]|nr:EAL domain-containing protein [Oscillospiraceae bacterium]
EDEKERQLIQAFVGAASTYGAKVCVEGIETEGMRDILQKYHIQSFQGYYYAKPLVLADMLNWEPKKKI